MHPNIDLIGTLWKFEDEEEKLVLSTFDIDHDQWKHYKVVQAALLLIVDIDQQESGSPNVTYVLSLFEGQVVGHWFSRTLCGFERLS